MRKLVYVAIGAALGLGSAVPALAQDDRRADRHDRHHERLEDRHDRVHDRLEEQHDRAHEQDLSRREHRRLHDRLDDRHDRAHRKLERRHDDHHDRDWRYDRRDDGYWGRNVYDDGRYSYGRYSLRGEGWSRLGWIAGDPYLAPWVLRNFDHNRNGSLGKREAGDAERAIYRMADYNDDGYLSRRELNDWRRYVARY